MSPVFLWKLVLSFLDTLKQSVLEMDIKTLTIRYPDLVRQDTLFNFSVLYKNKEAEGMKKHGKSLPGRCGRVPLIPSRSHHHSGLRRAGSRSA